MRENLRKPGGIILNREITRTAVEIPQSPAEKEYFRNLSDRILRNAAVHLTVTPAATYLISLGVEWASKDEIKVNPIYFGALGLASGILSTGREIWRLRNERFPKTKGVNSANHQS